MPAIKPTSRLFGTKPLFLVLLPAFFVLHGFTRNYSAVPAGGALLLTLFYIGITIAFAALGWLFFRNLMKACVFAFLVMSYHFFFGNIQDLLKNLLPYSFLPQYRFLLPASFLVFLVLIISLKRRKKPFPRLITYLNIVLPLLLLIDSGWLISKMMQKRKPLSIYQPTACSSCDTCVKPDIYLILLDQYAGARALQEVFKFDNSAFETELSSRGFYIVPGSRSNYNLTPFSMASTLNMEYLGPEMGEKKKLNVGHSYQVIRNNQVLHFLTTCGYQFYNYSVFDFPGKPAHKYGAFLPYGTQLITKQTFVSRLMGDIRADILSGKLPFKSARKKIAYEYLHFNDDIFKLTRTAATSDTSSPKFVYAHFMLPHYPYYFDSEGNALPMEKLSGFKQTDANDYLEYLQYGNKRVLELVDQIMASSPKPPVILLLSDHGFRHPRKNVDRKYDFMNLNAIYLPGKDPGAFYEGMSNVNQFRLLFNAYFGQHYPMLKDSTVDLWD